MGLENQPNGVQWLVGIMVCFLCPPLVLFIIQSRQNIGPAGIGAAYLFFLQLGGLIILTLLLWIPGVILAIYILIRAHKDYTFANHNPSL
jgi:uncharacterized membrane protein YqaE (UPF0057 family)